jgi:hypothetical protein
VPPAWTCPSLGLAHFLKNASVPSTVFCSSGNWVAIPRMCDCVIVRSSVSIYAALSAVSGPSRVAMRRGRCRKVRWWTRWMMDDIWVCVCISSSIHPSTRSLARSIDPSRAPGIHYYSYHRMQISAVSQLVTSDSHAYVTTFLGYHPHVIAFCPRLPPRLGMI